jgi:hypothetical protein
MHPKTFHAIGTHHKVDADKTLPVHHREPLLLRRVRILSIVLIIIAWAAPIVPAEPYEVLVVDIAAADDSGRIEEIKKDAAKFNSLHRRGYSAARPYFNLLHMADGRVFFVFGFRGKVQGIHRRDFSGTVKNLKGLRHKGVQKYPHIHWLPVAEIRRLLAAPT